MSFSLLAQDKVLIYIRDDVYQDYLTFLNGRDVHTIDQYSGDAIRRDVVDLILAQQALKLGGFSYQIIFAPGKVNYRNKKLLSDGLLLLSLDTYWLSDAEEIAEHVHISPPIIRKGEYLAGLYTAPNNKKALSVKSVDELKNFTIVSTPEWQTDWKTVNALPFKEIVKEDEWVSMARMVFIQWVDFILMPFHSSKNREFYFNNQRLIPVPNIAVLLDDSRHFVISKKLSLIHI